MTIRRSHARNVGLTAALFVLGLSAGRAQATTAQHRLSDLSVIRLLSGPNRIEHFAPDGRPAIITLGWRDNGNAHGYDLFLVLMPAEAGSSVWNVVDVETGGPDELDKDTIRDDPHTGEDFVAAVRFARGLVDSSPATVMLTARRRDSPLGIPAPSLVDFDVYRLGTNERGFGTVDYFEHLETTTSTMEFCNAEMAISLRFHIPLPQDYSGPKTDDGC